MQVEPEELIPPIQMLQAAQVGTVELEALPEAVAAEVTAAAAAEVTTASASEVQGAVMELVVLVRLIQEVLEEIVVLLEG